MNIMYALFNALLFGSSHIFQIYARERERTEQITISSRCLKNYGERLLQESRGKKFLSDLILMILSNAIV